MVDEKRLALQNELRGRILSEGYTPQIKEFLARSEGDYLEIGSYYAYFLTAMAIQFPDKKVYGIDPHISDGYTAGAKGEAIPEVEEVADFNTSLVDNVELIKLTTKDFLKKKNASKILKNISCVLVDGSHYYDDIVHDLELVTRIENDYEKLVAFDDLQIADVSKAFDELHIKLTGRIIDSQKNAHTAFIYYK